MTYERFEDLPVWQEAARLYESAEDLLENESFHASLGFRDPKKCAAISRQIVAGKIQNSRNSLLRAAREMDSESERTSLEAADDSLARQIQGLAR